MTRYYAEHDFAGFAASELTRHLSVVVARSEQSTIGSDTYEIHYRQDDHHSFNFRDGKVAVYCGSDADGFDADDAAKSTAILHLLK